MRLAWAAYHNDRTTRCPKMARQVIENEDDRRYALSICVVGEFADPMQVEYVCRCPGSGGQGFWRLIDLDRAPGWEVEAWPAT